MEELQKIDLSLLKFAYAPGQDITFNSYVDLFIALVRLVDRYRYPEDVVLTVNELLRSSIYSNQVFAKAILEGSQHHAEFDHEGGIYKEWVFMKNGFKY